MILIGLTGRPSAGRRSISRYLGEQCGFAILPIGPPALSIQERAHLPTEQLEVWLPCIGLLLKVDRHVGFPGVVVPDVQADREATWLRERGGRIWHVVRPGHLGADPDGPTSSVMPIEDDDGLVNDGTLGELTRRIDHLVDKAHALIPES